MSLSTTVVLQPSDIENAITTPTLLVPAPGPGKFIVPTWSTIEYVAGPDALSYSSLTGESFVYYYGTTQPNSGTVPYPPNMLPLTSFLSTQQGTTGASIMQSGISDATLLSTVWDNQPLYTSMLSDATTPYSGGDGTLYVTTHYFIQNTAQAGATGAGP